MYTLELAAPTRKALRKLRRSGRLHAEALRTIFTHLEQGKALPQKFQDHALQGKFLGYRECHVSFNLLLIYERDEALKLITISDIGSHPELFGE